MKPYPCSPLQRRTGKGNSIYKTCETVSHLHGDALERITTKTNLS